MTLKLYSSQKESGSAVLGYVLLFLFSMIVFTSKVQAQRAARPSINDATLWGSSAKRSTLRNYILDWITPEMNTQHSSLFGDIHNTRNFLPWHRIHIREIEDYINEIDPLLLAPSGLLPYYNPANPLPAEFLHEYDDFVPPFVPTQQNPVMRSNPNYNQSFSLCTTANSNPGAFSNNLELNYHNGGHVAIAGHMAGTTWAAACAIFWPWHAWVDEKWFQWECQCNNVFNMDTPAELNIAANTTWNTNRTVRGVVTIQPGATLTVNSGAKVRFAPTEYNGCVTRVIVRPGGRLIVDNAELTGLDEFGTGGDGGSGIHYFSGWEGIIVEGSGTPSIGAQGRITVINNGIISHATTAIEAKNGGLVTINGAKFLNNRFDVVIGDHKYVYVGYINNCEMLNDRVLRDISWTSSPVGGVAIEHHFNHHDSHSSEVHVTVGTGAIGVKGVGMLNCKIDNTFKDPHDNYLSIGVKTANSRVTLQGGSIKNQVKGVLGANSIPGPGRQVTVRGGTLFESNNVGVDLRGVDNSSIMDGCSFLIPKNVSNGSGVGIFCDGSGALTIADNNFSPTGSGTNTTYGVILSNTSNNFASVEKRNTFTDVDRCSQVQGANGNLQIRCNSYNSFDYGIAVTSGALANQGLCNGVATSPAGNVWDNLNGCSGNESQVFKDPNAAGFEYRAHNNRVPTCNSAGVFVNNCQIPALESSCVDPNPCPSLPCDKEILISDLEQQKSGADQSTVTSLTFKQQSILQEEINFLLEDPNAGLDPALSFIAAVEPITETYPVHKAALLLQKSESGEIASGTGMAISSIPSTDPNKAWLELQLNLLTSNRGFADLSDGELAMINAEAAQPTKSGAHARAIQLIGFGTDRQTAIEPINTERSAKPVQTSVLEKSLSIAPNPANNWVLASFEAPQETHSSMLTLYDMNGRTAKEMNISDEHGPSQVSVSLDGVKEGIYLLRLTIDGQVKGIQKIVVMR